MTTIANKAGAAAVLGVPLVVWSGDQLRMRAEGTGDPGAVSEYGRAEALHQLAAIESAPGLFAAAGWLALVAAVLTGPAVVWLWRRAVAASPRWAWSGLLLGLAFAFGQVVHLVGYFGLHAVAAQADDRAAAADLLLAVEGDPLLMAAFVPFLVGFVFAFPVLAVALRRAKEIHTWQLAAVLAGTATLTVLGSTPLATSAWAAGVLLGLAPVVRAGWRVAAPDHRLAAARLPATT